MKRTILFNFMKKKLSIQEERQTHYVSHISIWHISFLKRIRYYLPIPSFNWGLNLIYVNSFPHTKEILNLLNE